MKTEEVGGASADRALAEMEMTAGELALMNVIGQGIPKIEAASMGARVKRLLEAIPERYKCSTEEVYAMLENHTAGLIRDAIPLIESCDSRGLDRRLHDFYRAATVAASMTEPRPMPLPSLATYRHFGWDSAEAECLKLVLFTPMLGAKRGDVVASIDEGGVVLSSGLSLSKGAIVAACVPASQRR